MIVTMKPFFQSIISFIKREWFLFLAIGVIALLVFLFEGL